MKIPLKIFAALLITVATISCNQEPEGKTNSNVENQHSTPNGLRLNDGAQWIANAETTEGVNNMVKIMDSFDGKDNVDAYSKLSEDLQTEFNLIFQNCTMKGESHNQAHSFLVPMKELFQGISSTELSSCKSSYKKLRSHLDKYKEFFK